MIRFSVVPSGASSARRLRFPVRGSLPGAALVVILLAACARDDRPRPVDGAHRVAPAAAPNSSAAAPTGAAVPGSGSSAAADSLFEPTLATVKSFKTTCYALEHWLVVAQEKDEVGSDLIVRRRGGTTLVPTATTCAFDSLPGDYVVRNKNAEYFGGVRRDWLFLESGTGPQSSWVIHDLVARRATGSLEADEIVGWRDRSTLTVWLRIDTLPHAKCPNVPESLVAGLDSLVDVDLRTGQRVSFGKWRCAAWQ